MDGGMLLKETLRQQRSAIAGIFRQSSRSQLISSLIICKKSRNRIVNP